MTAFDYTRLRSTAERLIARFGQSATLTRVATSGTAYDPTTTETDYTVTVAVMEYTDRERDGTLIKVGDKKVYLSTSGLSITPGVADKITIGGVEHEIINVMPLNPGGTVVMYETQARR